MATPTARKNTRSAKVAPLTHIDAKGRAQMVDVGAKGVTERVAVASATLVMKPATLQRINSGNIAKGEVFAVARVAGIMAAKRTHELIPLCHPLPINVAVIEFSPAGRGRLEVRATVKVSGKTGVEMEALCAVTTAALTVYDMCKAIDRGMLITDVGVVEKSGGRSGDWVRV